MPFGIEPVIRGLCDACGTSRNLWAKELGLRVGCKCAGCEGAMVVKYTGPKVWMPDALKNAQCQCHLRPPLPAASAPEPTAAVTDGMDDTLPRNAGALFDVDEPAEPAEPLQRQESGGIGDAIGAAAASVGGAAASVGAAVATAAPVVRGQCSQCMCSRNLKVTELGGMEEMKIHCHCRPYGCGGVMVVVYTGPKGLIPEELHGIECRCAERHAEIRAAARAGAGGPAASSLAGATRARSLPGVPGVPGGVVASLGDARRAAGENAERLGQMSEAAAEMEGQASGFAEMAKQMRLQQESGLI